MRAAMNMSIVCYDMFAISRFFRSCALTIATQQTTHIEWQTYRDSTILNAVYAALFWKEPPGLAEVKMGTRATIDRRTDEMHLHFLLTWIRKLAEKGPTAAHGYVSEMSRLRDSARDAVQEVFRDASGINNEVIGAAQQAIDRLALIKLTAQVGVALIGGVAAVAFVAAAAGGAAAGSSLTILGLEAGASGTGFAIAGAAHSITHSVVKNWEAGPKAQFAGVTWEAGKAGASALGDHITGHSLEHALKGSAKAQQIIRSAEGEITKYSARLAQEGLKKKAMAKAANIVANRSAQVAAQNTAMQSFGRQATNAARFGKGIPVLFAAWDIWDAVGDYRETMETNR
jgi:hypothetical protein